MYSFTKEDKMKAFDNTLALYFRALLDMADSGYESDRHLQEVKEHREQLRIMYWKEIREQE